MEVYQLYSLNQKGISYAAQGWHIGDGLTLQGWVIENHLIIEETLHDLGILKAQTHGHARRKNKG